MPNTANLSKFIPGKGFDELVRKFKAELSALEALIQEKTTETILRLGKYVQQHLLENKGRADYGEYLISNLAEKVGKDPSTIRRILKFHRLYSIRGLAHELTWGHYQRLIGVEDDEERSRIEDKIIKEGWSTLKLRQYLSKRRKFVKARNDSEPVVQLGFTRGKIDVFEVIKDDDAENEAGLVLDFGFRQTVPLPDAAKFKEGEFVQIARDADTRLAMKVDVKKDYIYTYKAQVKRVIDGDTLLVRLGVEFGIVVRWKLRLRGIDCPEMDTEEGKQAKRFVQNRLSKCDFIVVKTYKDSADKYDRYLADIFYMLDEKDPDKVAQEGIYLNQELLDKGLAVAYNG